MKTILQALKDEVHYKLSSGFFENRLLERELNGNDECTVEIFKSKPFKGAVADCLRSLVQAQNYTEGDVSMSLSRRLKKLRNLLIQFTVPLERMINALVSQLYT